MRLATIKQKGKAFLAEERGQRLAKAGRRLFMTGIIGLLLYQLSQVGWDQIGQALPASPWFYLIFLVLYFSLPATEALVYRQLWHYRYVDGFLAFLKKRVLNKDVLGYSGDVYLYLWARENVGKTEREVRGAVKDNAILSSVASTAFSVGVLVLLFLTGQILWTDRIAGHEATYLAAILLAGGIGAALAVRFRKVLFDLPGRMAAALFAIHVTRLVLMGVLQVVQWSVAMPGTSWRVWGTLFAVQTVMSRIPILPARDFIFVGTSVELSRALDVSAAGIAGMLLVSNLLDKAFNFLFFTLSALLARRRRFHEGQATRREPVLPVEDVAGV
jgi:hypothetical protein